MPFGCAAYQNDYSTSRSSCYDWHIRNPNRRSCGSTIHAGAGWRSILPTNRSGSCGRLRRWFRAWSDRRRSYTPCNRFACKWHHFHSPVPRYGCRSPGRSTNRKSQDRGLYTHKSLNSEHNGTCSTRNTADALWMYASWKRRSPARNTAYSLGRCRQYRWMHGMQLLQVLS